MMFFNTNLKSRKHYTRWSQKNEKWLNAKIDDYNFEIIKLKRRIIKLNFYILVYNILFTS